MRLLLLRLRLYLEEFWIWTGLQSSGAEIVGKVPSEVVISGVRVRKHDLGCGLIGFAEVHGGLSKVILKAVFYDVSDNQCDTKEKSVLVYGGASFWFSLLSSNKDSVRASLQIETSK